MSHHVVVVAFSVAAFVIAVVFVVASCLAVEGKRREKHRRRRGF